MLIYAKLRFLSNNRLCHFFILLSLRDCILELIRCGTPIKEAMYIYKMNKNVYATIIRTRKHEHYSKIINHVRTHLRFALLKSILVAVRGYRGKSRGGEMDIGEIDFNLIPEGSCYEGGG